MNKVHRVSLRERLTAQQDGESAVIAYLTLGDPVDNFLDCAQSILDAGALTLELGVPLDTPREGPVLLASHARARAGGTDEVAALALLAKVHAANPKVPLIAVNHWHALGSGDTLEAFVESAATAGATAVLIVGLPLGQVVPFRRACDKADVESVLSCFPDTPRRMRALIYRQTTGCIYVARSRGDSGGTGVNDVDQLCRDMREETELPIIVGFGIDDSAGVVRNCDSGAKAAVIGSALVERMARSPAEGARFVNQLLFG